MSGRPPLHRIGQRAPAAWWLVLPLSTLLSGCVVPLERPVEDRVAYVESHEALDPDVARAIRLGRVVAGMTREEVEAAWGSPSAVDHSESLGLHAEWGKEVWEYRSDAIFIVHPEATVFFDNGKVSEVSPVYLSDLED